MTRSWTFLLTTLLAINLVRGVALADVVSPTPSAQGTYIGATSAGVQIQSLDQSTQTYVVEAAAKVSLANARPGDLITVAFADPKQPTEVTEIDLHRPTGMLARLVALFLSFCLLVFAASVVTHWKPQSFIVGIDNRYSNSQTQVALWFTAVMTGYLALLALRIVYLGWTFVGGISLPENLIVLSGFSAFSFGAARVIRQAQNGNPKAAAIPTANVTPKLADFVQNDFGTADVGDFQMLLIACIAIVIFLMTTFSALGQLTVATPTSLPDVDTTLLSLFGLGQGAYLVKKAGSAPGVG